MWWLSAGSCAVATGFAAVIAGCAEERGGGRAAAPAIATVGCPLCGAPDSIGAMMGAAMTETSGLAVSAAHTDVLYSHNDSGDSARFFAMTWSGGDLGTFQVAGADAYDWEDVAMGPCAAGKAGRCLYFADFGDNQTKRSSYALYRVQEPAQVGAARAQEPVPSEPLPYVYPDGSHNAETLLIHPKTGVITVVTKVSHGASPIYEFPMPLAPESAVTLVRVGEVAPPVGIARFTGGDVHPEGKGVLLRTYTHLFYYAMREGQTVAEALGGAPCVMPVAEEAQGEAVAWLPSGWGYLTMSEGEGASMHRVTCAWQ
jgi:hypothetical protein